MASSTAPFCIMLVNVLTRENVPFLHVGLQTFPGKTPRCVIVVHNPSKFWKEIHVKLNFNLVYIPGIILHVYMDISCHWASYISSIFLHFRIYVINYTKDPNQDRKLIWYTTVNKIQLSNSILNCYLDHFNSDEVTPSLSNPVVETTSKKRSGQLPY